MAGIRNCGSTGFSTCSSASVPPCIGADLSIAYLFRSLPTSARSERCLLLVGLLARWIVAAWWNEFVVHRLGEAQPLLHVRHDTNDLANQLTFFVLHDLGHEAGANGLSIFVELNLSVRRIEHHVLQGNAELFIAIAQFAVDLIECVEDGVS